MLSWGPLAGGCLYKCVDLLGVSKPSGGRPWHFAIVVCCNPGIKAPDTFSLTPDRTWPELLAGPSAYTEVKLPYTASLWATHCRIGLLTASLS